MIVKLIIQNATMLLDEIEYKLRQLKKLDKRKTIFGASSHRYAYGKQITERIITKFEKKYEVSLPPDFVNFLKRFGDGCCGPGYGLMLLNNGIYDIPTNKKESEIISLKKPFRLETYWNLEDFPKNDEDLWEDEYFDIKWTDGMLRICHLGCGIYCNLVVNGKEKGNIWIDDRGSDGGIYPNNHYTKTKNYDFLSWYDQWLNASIEEIMTNRK